ncbi:MAG TPA: class I SAM-dependent methyltransferase [Terriglobales bacterium]|nr:class I SAM-dependent methyltransferase [Terriglobales bacterium]
MSVRRILEQIGIKTREESTSRPAAPYPVRVRPRVYAQERVRKRGGAEVFDAPNAVAINEARMAHLGSLGLPLAGKRVLDLGAGIGHLANRLRNMGCTVVCMDGRESNIAVMQQRYPDLEGHIADVEKDSLSPFGRFDVVFAYGLLYHLENPLLAIQNMASVCDELLLLETIICDHKLPIVRIEDESKDSNQALSGLACRPSPHYVVLALSRAGFEHVYAPAMPPQHEDFQFEWKNNLDSSRDGHNLRCIFVASRHALNNPHLVSLQES